CYSVVTTQWFDRLAPGDAVRIGPIHKTPGGSHKSNRPGLARPQRPPAVRVVTPHNAPFSTYKAVLFRCLGHAVIAVRKPPQLFATGWIGKAIGQRSAFLSTGATAFRVCNMRSYVADLKPRGHGGNDPGEGTIKARHLQ